MTILLHSATPKGFQIFNKDIHPNIANIVASLSRTPEIRKLSNLVENNAYHDHENILDHVQTVFANVQELLKFGFIKSNELRKKYLSYFNEILDKKGNYKRNDLLLLAACLHDVGKGLKEEDDNPLAIGHDHSGATIVPSLLRNYNLTLKEVSIAQALVDLHDTFNETFCETYLTKEPNKDIPIIQQKQPLFYIELLIHILSDNAGAKPFQQWFEYLKNEIFQQKSLLQI